MKYFADSLHVVRLGNAKFFAEDLFRERFASDFPVPQDAYLEGGMCVVRNLYRRLPRPHREECELREGIARIMT